MKLHRLVCLSMSLGTLIVLPSGGLAQRAVADSAAAADSLHERAVELQSESRRFGQAAQLYMDQARLRPATDVSGVEALIMAGHLFHAVGQSNQAKQAFEQGADRARALGDVERAARAYLDAAFVAHAMNDRREVQRLGTAAAMLSSSPLLTQAQRDHILNRIRRVPADGESAARILSAADSLHEQALVLQAEQSGWERAADLYIAEANLRPAEDRAAVDVLILAANLLRGANLPLKARSTLERAGARAEAAGLVDQAARAYLDAALVAQHEGDRAGARSLASKAETLSASPLLTAQQRDGILRRINRVRPRGAGAP